MASPVDIASIFMRKGQTPTPETQTPSQGSSIIRSFFVREGGTEAIPAPQRPNPVLSYFDPVAYSQQLAAYNKSQGVEETAPKAEVKELTEEEKRNAEQRNKNKAFASRRPATIFSQPESSNIKIKKPTLGSGS